MKSSHSDMHTNESIELTIVEDNDHTKRHTKFVKKFIIRKIKSKNYRTNQKQQRPPLKKSPRESVITLKKPRKGGNMSPGVYKGKNCTYAELITYAIKSRPDNRMTLSEIYNWMKS